MLIQKLRLQYGWSQQQLADLSGISVRTIQRIERGSAASVETLKSLAAVFEIDFTSLQAESDMVTPLNSELKNQEILALEYVRKLKRFYVHLLQYLLVISGLAAWNLWHNPQHLWFFWPAFGWGIGILAHAGSTFDFLPFFNAAWEKKQVEKRLGRPL